MRTLSEAMVTNDPATDHRRKIMSKAITSITCSLALAAGCSGAPDQSLVIPAICSGTNATPLQPLSLTLPLTLTLPLCLSPDGIIDGSDFIAFINAFSAGC